MKPIIPQIVLTMPNGLQTSIRADRIIGTTQHRGKTEVQFTPSTGGDACTIDVTESPRQIQNSIDLAIDRVA